MRPSCHAHSRRRGSKLSGPPSDKCYFAGFDPPLKASLTPPSVPEAPPRSRAQAHHALPCPRPFSVQPTQEHAFWSAPRFSGRSPIKTLLGLPGPASCSSTTSRRPLSRKLRPCCTAANLVGKGKWSRYRLLRSQSAAAATAGPQPNSRPRHRRRRRRHLRPAWSAQPRLPSPPPPSTALGNPPATDTPETVDPIS